MMAEWVKIWGLDKKKQKNKSVEFSPTRQIIISESDIDLSTRLVLRWMVILSGEATLSLSKLSFF